MQLGLQRLLLFRPFDRRPGFKPSNVHAHHASFIRCLAVPVNPQLAPEQIPEQHERRDEQHAHDDAVENTTTQSNDPFCLTAPSSPAHPSAPTDMEGSII